MSQNNTTTSSKKPTHEVFQVRGTSKNYWIRVGAGWLHEDCEGLSISLNALPLDGRLVIRAVKKQ